MSEVIDVAVTALQGKMPSGFSGGVAKFVITGEGTIIADGSGVRAEDGDADVTLTATGEVFKAILSGEMNPTMAFMTGNLSVDGNMGLAMQLGASLG